LRKFRNSVYFHFMELIQQRQFYDRLEGRQRLFSLGIKGLTDSFWLSVCQILIHIQ
jgi:hypothetical protein